MGKIGGFFRGISTGMAKDEVVKNALTDYAAEHFEIAGYTSLIAAAQAIGVQQTAAVCQQNPGRREGHGELVAAADPHDHTRIHGDAGARAWRRVSPHSTFRIGAAV